MLYPARAICELARSRGVLSAIDGAQAVGSMEVQLHALGCDLYAASLHKWALGPAGNGFLYVRSGIEDRFDSLFTLGQKPGPATRHEAIGTYDLPCRAALARSIELLAQVGAANIEARNRYLSNRLKEGLRQIRGVRVISGPSPGVSSPAITLFEISGVSALKLQDWLYDHHRLVVDEHARHGLDAVRVSTHIYNQPAEVDRVVAGVAEFLKQRG
jgi:selenocysteine lyase/cysteine desulfurase